MGNIFGQASRLLGIAGEADLDDKRFEALNRTGILADVLRCENPALVDRESLKQVLAGMRVKLDGFPVWKTIEVGGLSRDELHAKLTAEGHRISDWAKDIMGKPDFVTSEKREPVDFVRLRVRDLGFRKEPTTTELFEHGLSLGLDLCQPEDGPTVRLAYGDQPMDEWMWLAMKQIVDSDGYPDVFEVERCAGGSWLRTVWADPDNRWGLDNLVVFRARKVQALAA